MSVLVLLSVCAVAVADPGNSPSQICKANDDFDLNHDTCTLCVAQGALEGNMTSTCACKILEDDGILGEVGFENLGQCVSSGFVF
jgi:hypothetical protein